VVLQPQSLGKGKDMLNKNNSKLKKTTIFKMKKNKREDEYCFMCGSPDHWAK
jgi:hypothetical protein